MPVILVALGSNLGNRHYTTPRQVCEAALRVIERCGFAIICKSRWYHTDPVPPSGQPMFVNGVIQIETNQDAKHVLMALHRIETTFGRMRRYRNEARSLDLDLIGYGSQILAFGDRPILPHPRMSTRGFVLYPLRDVAPNWRHPVTGQSVDGMIQELAQDQTGTYDSSQDEVVIVS